MREKGFKSFEELECWQACRRVRAFVYRITRSYPVEEKYGLIGDMRRAARSTTHNIAEGFGRFHYQENIQFCRQSRGSLCELADQLITSLDEGYLVESAYQEGRLLVSKALALVNGYINYLERQKKMAAGAMQTQRSTANRKQRLNNE